MPCLLQTRHLHALCRSGLHLIQLLPVNDTGVYSMWWDSYPYSTLSVFALHPMVGTGDPTTVLEP